MDLPYDLPLIIRKLIEEGKPCIKVSGNGRLGVAKSHGYTPQLYVHRRQYLHEFSL